MSRPLSAGARRKMIAAAHEVIDGVGVDGLTVDEVARRSGVAKSTIYRHFASVDDLVLAAIDELVHAADAPDTGSFRTDLRSVVETLLEVAQRPGFSSCFESIVSRGRRDPSYAQRVAAMRTARQFPLRIILQRGMARGEVDPDIDLHRAVHFAHAPFVTMLIDDVAITDSEVEANLDLVCRGLAPRA